MCRRKQYSILHLATILMVAFVAAVIMWGRVKDDAMQSQINAIELESLRKKKEQLQSLNAVVNFAWNHPDRAFIVSDATGEIVAAHGGCFSIGWTRQGLVGQIISDLCPNSNLEQYVSRLAEEGKGKQVIREFTSSPMFTEDGRTILVDGLIVWNEEREMYAAYLSPPKEDMKSVHGIDLIKEVSQQ